MLLPTPDDHIKSTTQLAQWAADLQDTEVAQLARVMNDVSSKYSTRRATVDNLEAMRDEILTRLAAIGILATVDVAPILNGEPPVVEIVGHVGGHEQNTHGMDHERKQYEVRKANERNEDYLGQKERPNSRREKK